MKKNHLFKKKLIYTAAAVSLSFSMLFTGCVKSRKVSETTTDKVESTTSANNETTTAANTPEYMEDAAEQEKFEEFLNDTFTDEITANTINLHYTLAEPEKYGIDKYDISLGDYSDESFKESKEDIEELLSKLQEFNYNGLSSQQRITYDILKQYFETESQYADLYLYNETLSSTIGEQAQLPIIMAEYKFYREQDIKDYLAVMKKIPEYFNSIIDFEKRKSAAGLFMCDYAVDDISKQCKEFIANPDENLLISTFDNKIDELSQLNTDAAKKYKKENLNIVKKQIIPAYQTLIDELNKLKGTGTNEGGLCNFPKGKEFYQYLINKNVGSYRSVDEINELLKSQFSKDVASCSIIYSLDSKILDKLNTYSDLDPDSAPENILAYLRDNINDAFPAGGSDTFTVKYIDKSLENFVSPAMYLTPAIDKTSENIIYINNASETEGSQRVTTIAHEGYPGHLYQTTYFAETNPSLIRNLVQFTGYTEGWATYVEIYAYGYGGLSDNAVKFNRLNKKLSLNIYSQIDVGINYYGWDKEKTREFLAENYDDATANEYLDEIYYAMVEEPGNYLNYYLGYLEFEELKNTAESKLGDKFNLKNFNKFLLDFGPAQFNVIGNYLDEWINEQ